MRWKVAVYAGLALAVAVCAVLCTARTGGAFPNEDIEGVPNAPVPHGTAGLAYSWLDRLVASPFNAVAVGLNKIAEWAKLRPIEDLVFNADSDSSSPMADAFTSEEWYNLVLPWYRAVLAFGTSVIVIESVILLKSYGYIASPSKRATVQEMLFNTGFAVLLAFGTPVLMRLILDANKAVVAFARNQAMSVSPSSSVEAARQASGSAILDAFISIADAGLMIYMNVLYLVRKFVLGILLIIAPIVGWSWMSRGTRQTALLMLSEILTNGMMTASHALPYAFFLTMLRLNGSLLGTAWAKLLGFTLIIPLSAFLRRMLIGFFDFLGMHEESAASAAVGGMASLAAVGTVMLGAVAGAGAHYAGTAVSHGGSGPGGGGNNGPAAGAALGSAAQAAQAVAIAGAGPGGTVPSSTNPAGSPTGLGSTIGVSSAVPAASAGTGVISTSGVNPEIQDIIGGEAGLAPEDEDEINYDPAPSALNPLLSYRVIPQAVPEGASDATVSTGPDGNPEGQQRAVQAGKSPWKERFAVAAGATAAGLGVATKVAGALVSLSAGPVGRQIGSAGQPLYDAGARIVRAAAKRRVTADESRYWRQMPGPGEVGRNAEAQPRPSAA